MGTVARIDVIGGPVEPTEGLAIGQTEAEAQQRDGGRLVVTPRPSSPGGRNLTFAPAGQAEASCRLVAETDGVVDTEMQAGRFPR
jgi:hypothetical protein